MTRIMISQVLVNGLVSGFVYALTAAGFSLLYGNANILFLAIGEIYMLGAITFYALVVKAGLPYFGAMLIVVAAMGALGVMLERFLFRPLKGSELTFAFATLALGMLIAGIALVLFGEQGKGLPAVFPGRLKALGIVVPYDKIVIVGIALSILLGFHFYFKYTKTGRAIRAVSQDVEAAKLMGVDISRIKGLTFFLALAVAGAGGALVTPLYYADVFMGDPVLMTTLIVVVLGGLGSFPGAIYGGLLIGLLESFGYTFIGGITTIILFCVVIGLLIFRPQGLLGGEK
jgi:branched-chain amino acid transport system permease protein